MESSRTVTLIPGVQQRHAFCLVNSTTDSVARSPRLNNSRPESVDVFVQTSEADYQHIIVSFDSGARYSHNISAYACCVWTNTNDLVWWSASAVHPSGTNNEMEANGLLAGIRWLYCHHRTTPIQIFGDSAVAINLAQAKYRVAPKI
ncbi:hypothetical protein JG688_00010627 [Phytophthora aleatoria]|uniref:RNase H type-1 domain-containing protein n=1 Tax=Phytophthora aleatoria TaxID=2496075 RepID=A0A8J5J4S8_9STRA|nr:hypothetical protein JG688_00010627 [Phytophthora aleatoria]